MRKFLLPSLIALTVITLTAQADTIHLKNGSILKGKVTSFADDQFVVMLDTGSGRYMSKATVYMGDVSKIEFDSAPASPIEPVTPAQQPETSARSTSNELPVGDTKTETGNPVSSAQVKSPPQSTSTRETGPPADTQPSSKEPAPPERPIVTSSPATSPAAADNSESERLNRKPLVAIKSMTVDVVAKKDWTSSGLIVRRGDRLRVTATGTITLDPVSGRTSGPEGISDLADPKKLMPDQPTGALIGVISSDNDDFIFIGRSNEFTAMRDGLLFLSVNEGVLSDNLGTFKAVVEVLSTRK